MYIEIHLYIYMSFTQNKNYFLQTMNAKQNFCATVQCQPMCGWRILVKHGKTLQFNFLLKTIELALHHLCAQTEQKPKKLFRNIQVQHCTNQTGIQISQLNRRTTHKMNLFPRHQFIIDVDSNNSKVFSSPLLNNFAHWAKEMSKLFWPNSSPFRNRSTFSTSITGAVR